MTSTFVNLLKDPSATYLDASDGYCELLGSLDSYHMLHRKLENTSEYFRYGNHAISTGYESLQSLLTDGYGIESAELTEMITGFIKKIFNAIYNTIARVIKTITSLFTKVAKVDKRIRDNAEELYTKFKELKSKNEGNRQDINTYFSNQLVTHMCAKKEILEIMQAYEKIASVITIDAHSEIKKRIASMSTDQSGTPDWVTHTLLSDLEHLGITLTDSASKYSSPFKDRPEASLGTLGFTTVDSVDEVNLKYNDLVWSKYNTLKKLVDNLKEYQSTLKNKEAELLKDVSIDRQIVTQNAVDIQKHISIVISIFAALKQVNTTLNFRRKRVTEIGLRALDTSNHKKD